MSLTFATELTHIYGNSVLFNPESLKVILWAEFFIVLKQDYVLTSTK